MLNLWELQDFIKEGILGLISVEFLKRNFIFKKMELLKMRFLKNIPNIPKEILKILKESLEKFLKEPVKKYTINPEKKH